MSTALTPTLPAAAYLSDDVWADERERIWFRQWVAVGRVEDVVERSATGSWSTSPASR